MIKIPYPDSTTDFDTLYLKKVYNTSNAAKFKKADRLYLNAISYKGKPLTVKRLLIAKFEDLIAISKRIDSTLTAQRKANLNQLFVYHGKNQQSIASFFMEQDQVPLDSCFCCNIDYINSFSDIADYKTGLELLNHGEKHELLLLEGVGASKVKKIIDFRVTKDITEADFTELKLNEATQKQLKSLDFKDKYNHFTLDHFLPQKEYKYLSLCLYNFVPTCYSCNSKFKKAKEFTAFEDKEALKYVSPTSKDFSVQDDFSFKIYYPKDLKDIKTDTDYKLEKHIQNNKELVQEYLNIYKLEGRYVFHKKQLLQLITAKVKYPESKIKELAKTLKLPENILKESIFGAELFDEKCTTKPLTKLKQDIAKDIKIT